AEEQRAVLGLVSAESAIRIALGDTGLRAAARREELERCEQIIGAREPRVAIALHAAIDDRREPLRYCGRDDTQRPRIFVLGRARELLDREVAERPLAGEQLVEHDAERVQIGADIGGLAAPQL